MFLNGVLWHGGALSRACGVFHMCGHHPGNASHAPHHCDNQKQLLHMPTGPLGARAPGEPLPLMFAFSNDRVLSAKLRSQASLLFLIPGDVCVPPGRM